MNIRRWDKWLQYWDYNPKFIGNFTFRKNQMLGRSLIINRKDANFPRCALNPMPLGRWIPLTNGTCSIDGKCNWSLDRVFLENDYNIKKGIHHTFAPFNCTYHYFSRRQAIDCIKRSQLKLLGDSRMGNFHGMLVAWLKEDAPSADEIGIRTGVNLHSLGILAILPAKYRERLTTWITEGRPIIINSMLHDLAEFVSFNQVEIIGSNWDPLYCPACKNASETVGNCGCPPKTDAVFLYMMRVRKLFEIMKAAQQLRKENGGEPAPIFWITHSKRPPSSMATDAYSWQTMDMLDDLVDFVARTAKEMGINHIDLRPHVATAPAKWWDDPVHYGRNYLSLFKHVSLQIVLNTVCPLSSSVT
jgi:hypothetical protein